MSKYLVVSLEGEEPFVSSDEGVIKDYMESEYHYVFALETESVWDGDEWVAITSDPPKELDATPEEDTDGTDGQGDQDYYRGAEDDN